MLKFADRYEYRLSDIISHHFDKLSDNEDVRNQLMLKVAIYDSDIAIPIASNYYKLPEDVRNLLFKFVDDPNSHVSLVRSISSNYDKLPEDVRNLLGKIIDKIGGSASYSIAETIKSNFDKLPSDLRNSYLRKLLLINVPSARWSVYETLENNFDKFDRQTRNELLIKLPDNFYVRGNVIKIIIDNLDKLRDDIKYLLCELSDNRYAAGSVAEMLKDNFGRLQPEVRNEVLHRIQISRPELEQ